MKLQIMSSYTENLEKIKTKTAQLKILKTLTENPSVENEIIKIENEIELIKLNNLKYEIALECISEEDKYIIQLKYIENRSWSHVEVKYNDTYPDKYYIPSQTLARRMKKAIRKLQIILAPSFRNIAS